MDDFLFILTLCVVVLSPVTQSKFYIIETADRSTSNTGNIIIRAYLFCYKVTDSQSITGQHREKVIQYPLTKEQHDIQNKVSNRRCLLHCKNRLEVFLLPAGMSLTKLSLALGIIKLFPARESLFSDIPAGSGKQLNFFYSVALTVWEVL
jgi:hypothetical protein